MKLLRKIALAWMFAWLPVSGVMASTMPLCAQSMGGAMQAAAATGQMDAMPCHDGGAVTAEADTQPPIEHCDLCHLAGALAAPTLPFVANAAPGVAPFDASVSDFRSWVPDPPQHPPLFSPV
ncbi:MAG: hypothetical protein SF172_00885 [Burkholderiales bacterium]|nr:hypothetical protein [Burkholderiales bacterium]